MSEPAGRPVFVNGRFLTQALTGVQRYAREMVLALDDCLAESGSNEAWCLLLPGEGTERLPLRRIEQRSVGATAGHLWEQVELPWHARGGWLLGFGNTGPLLHGRQVVTIHDAQVFARPSNFSTPFRVYYRMLLPLLGRRAQRVVTVSRFSADELNRYGIAPAERIECVRGGTDHVLRSAPDDAVLARHGLRQGRYVLTIGSLSASKNVATVLAAWAALGDPDLKLAVAGAVNPRVFGADAAPAATGAIWLGAVTDAELCALYRNALCLVAPSLYEGFSLPPAEAMSLGCPVIASRIPAHVELFADAIMSFHATDVPALSALIRKLDAEPALRAQLAARGRAVAAGLTWRHSARRLLQVLSHLRG